MVERDGASIGCFLMPFLGEEERHKMDDNFLSHRVRVGLLVHFSLNEASDS